MFFTTDETVQDTEARIYVPLSRISVVNRGTAVVECIPYGTPESTIQWSKVCESYIILYKAMALTILRMFISVISD